MDITDLFGLLGGLALFLYGMQMMSDGLEDAAGDRMEKILEKLTANRFLGVAVGAVITAIIQSSSATTVMVVGFVNSGMMTLQQAVWIIMGANIGTTITGQLLTLDVGAVAPFIAFLGVAMIVFVKSPKVHHFGKILAGFGMLFIGMDNMGAAMKPLQEMESFVSLMTTFSNPLLGILAGAVFTAVIQSSSASVGILQTLAGNGLIPFSSAVFVLFGQNIGTCITAVLASIGTNRSAKRTTIIHLMFNIIGTIIFTTVCLLFPLADFIASFTPGNPTAQIANMHTTFNIATTILLVPFGTYLAKAAEKILPDTAEELGEVSMLRSLKKEFGRNRTNLGADAIHLDVLRQEVERMISLAGQNVERSFQAVADNNIAILKKAEEKEEIIDALNNDISQYISKILVSSNSGQNVTSIEQYFLITGNAERIGDHAMNIAGYVDVMKKKSIVFSEDAKREIIKMQEITKNAMDKVLHKEADTTKWLSEVASMEQQIDDMTKRYRERHLERMRKGLCNEEACVLYSELLTDFERIGDHALNIAQCYTKIYSYN
ncbi:MAG: Na/Pi cotransporter family protein [Lachnospiraceae bacterium]|nr:Na/Pi cotransporter family protein [Lachnospiraceae bacterium]